MEFIPKRRLADTALVAALYTSLIQFLIRYRRTALGPLWLLVGPSLFIVVLGRLYAHIGSAEAARFIPHLSVGLVLWTLVSGFVIQAPTVFQRGKAQIMMAGRSLDNIILVDMITTVLGFLHQLPIVAAVFLIYRVPLSWGALESLVGLVLVIVNGLWVTHLFAILGARYRDLTEVFQAVMRIAFLATPIIWMTGQGVQGGVMGAFLTFNPFYHYLEIVRAPLLGQPVAPLSWIVVVSITILGSVVAGFFKARYSRYVPLWV